MVNDTTVIEAKIVASIDQGSFRDGVKFAKDTGKAIDQELRAKLRIDTLLAEDKIKEINQLLKTNLPPERRIQLRLDLADAKRNLTETKRELNNLSNTGDQTTSRLQAKFNATNEEIAKSNTLLGKLKSNLLALATTAGVVAIVGGLTRLVNVASEASATIAKTTGATGNALKGLEKDFAAVFAQVPQGSSEVSKAIGEVNTRFDVTGETLQNLSKQFLDFADATDTSVESTTRSISRLSQDFGIGLDGIPLLLDKVLLASQSTGIGVEKLTDTVTTFGVQFRTLGFGLDESIALISQFEAQGVNTEGILAGLNKGVNELAKQTGQSIPEAFSGFISSLEKAEDTSRAVALASEVLGSRAGPQLALAVREGRLELGELVNMLGNAEGALGRTDAASETVAEKIAVSFNQLLSALQPVFLFIGTAVKGLLDAFVNFPIIIGLATGAMVAFGVVMTTALGPVGIFLAGVGSLIAVVTTLSGIFGGTELALTSVSAKAGELGIELDILKGKIVDLDAEYKAGKLTIDEYTAAKSALNAESAKTQAQIDAEIELQELLNAEYVTAQTEISKNQSEIQHLQTAIARGERSTSAFGDTLAHTSASVQANKDRLNELVLKNRELSTVQEGVIVTSEDVGVAIDSISTAKSRAEFFSLKLAAIDVVKGYAITLDGQLKFQRGMQNQSGVDAAIAGLEGLKTTLANIAKIQPPAVFSAVDADLGDDKDKPGGGGSGGGKSKAAVEADRLAKELEDSQQAALDRQVEGFKLAFDAIGESIKSKESAIADFTKEIEKSAETIEGLDEKISELGEKTASDLASRFVTIQESLADESIVGDERSKLEEELALIEANTTEQERQEAVRVAGLSTTEAILEARDAELLKLEELRAAELTNLEQVTAARDAQQIQLDLLRAVELDLSEKAIAQTQKEFTEKTKAAKQFESVLDALIRKQAEAIAGGAGGLSLGGVGAGGDVIDQSTNTVNVDQIVIPDSLTPEQTVEFILQAIKDAQKQS